MIERQKGVQVAGVRVVLAYRTSPNAPLRIMDMYFQETIFCGVSIHAHFRHDPAPQESCIQESAILPNVKTGIEANCAGIINSSVRLPASPPPHADLDYTAIRLLAMERHFDPACQQARPDTLLPCPSSRIQTRHTLSILSDLVALLAIAGKQLEKESCLNN